MSQERITLTTPKDPLPESTCIQTVTKEEDGGWKAVIKCPENESNDCDQDHKFSGLTAGINEQRRQALFHRMGIR